MLFLKDFTSTGDLTARKLKPTGSLRKMFDFKYKRVLLQIQESFTSNTGEFYFKYRRVSLQIQESFT